MGCVSGKRFYASFTFTCFYVSLLAVVPRVMGLRSGRILMPLQVSRVENSVHWTNRGSRIERNASLVLFSDPLLLEGVELIIVLDVLRNNDTLDARWMGKWEKATCSRCI